MAMGEAYAQGSVSDNSGEGEVCRFDVVVAFDDLEVRCNGTQEIERLFVREVSKAKNLTDFAWSKKFLELWEMRTCPVTKS